MILSDREIGLAMDQGRLLITPRPGLDYMDSTTVDLCLGDSLDTWKFSKPDPNLGQAPLKFLPGSKDFKFSALEAKYSETHDISTVGYDLDCTPGKNFIRGWTREKIHLPYTSRLCARVEGKSSLARMGLGVHVTAPTVHSGFGYNERDPSDHGTSLRLEIWNVGPLPIQLIAGMRICQLIIEEVREVPTLGYQNRSAFNDQGPQKK